MLARKAARKLKKGGFGGVIGGVAESGLYDVMKEDTERRGRCTYFERNVGGLAGDEHDASPAPESQHLLASGLRGEERAFEVDVQPALEVGLGALE